MSSDENSVVRQDMDSDMRPDVGPDRHLAVRSAVCSDMNLEEGGDKSLSVSDERPEECADISLDQIPDESSSVREESSVMMTDVSSDESSSNRPYVRLHESSITRSNVSLHESSITRSNVSLEGASVMRSEVCSDDNQYQIPVESSSMPDESTTVREDSAVVRDESSPMQDERSALRDDISVVRPNFYPGGNLDGNLTVGSDTSFTGGSAVSLILESDVNQDEALHESSAGRSDMSSEEGSVFGLDLNSDVNKNKKTDEDSDKSLDASSDMMSNKGSDTSLDVSCNVASDVLPQFAFCSIHNDTELDTFCEIHQCLVCYKCTTTKHRKCRLDSVTDKIYANQERLLGSDIDVCSTLLQRAQQLVESRESDKADLADSVKRCRADVEVLRERINFRIDQIGQTLDSYLQSLESRLNSDIDKHVTSCKHLIEDIKVQREKLETCQRYDTTTTYIGQNTAHANMKEMGELLRELETECGKKFLEFKPCANIDKLFDELNELGEIVVSGTRPSTGAASGEDERETVLPQLSETRETSHHSKTEEQLKDNTAGKGRGWFRKGMRVARSTFVYVRRGRISGSSFFPDGSLVICDSTNLLHFTETFNYKSGINLPTFIHDVAIISNEKVVATLPGKSQLQFLTTRKGLNLDSIVKLDRKCYGIDYRNGKVYVCCRDGGESGGRGEVLILSLSDNVLSRIGQISTGERYMFKCPDYICVNTDGSRIYVSDVVAGTITCLSETGQIVDRYQEERVSRPVGMCLDNEGQLAVCGYGSGIVFLLGDEPGLLSESISEKSSRCLTYRPKDGAFVVGMDGGVLVFWLR